MRRTEGPRETRAQSPKPSASWGAARAHERRLRQERRRRPGEGPGRPRREHAAENTVPQNLLRKGNWSDPQRDDPRRQQMPGGSKYAAKRRRRPRRNDSGREAAKTQQQAEIMIFWLLKVPNPPDSKTASCDLKPKNHSVREKKL